MEAWNGGERRNDYEYLHPEFTVRSNLYQRDFHGPEGLLAWYREIEEQFDRWTVHVDDGAEIAGNRCLMTGRINFRGRESGIELDTPIYWVFEFEDGLVRRLLNTRDIDAARGAAGLSA
jgi:hypothetical protein